MNRPSDKQVTCLFLGSGASKALAEIPIQRDFMCTVLNEKRSGWIDGCGLEIGGRGLSSWMLEVGDIERCMSYLHNVAYGNNKSQSKKLSENEKSARKSIVNMRAAIADHLRKFKPEPDIGGKFKDWLSKFGKKNSSLVFITTNYDLILENLLGENQYYYPEINGNNCKTDLSPIYKLHGSINWLEKRWWLEGTEELKSRKKRVADVSDISDNLVFEPPEKNKWPCLIRWKEYNEKGAWGETFKTYNPILVPFFYQKDDWLGDGGGWNKIFPSHWESAKKILEKGLTHVYFLGYGLPPADHHLMSWLLNILQKANNPRITIVNSNNKPEPLEKALNGFRPRVCQCGLERFLKDHF